MPPDLLARFCKVNLPMAKNWPDSFSSLACLIYCDQGPLWLLNVIEDDCYFLGAHIRLLTRCNICFTLGLFCTPFFSKITQPFPQKYQECALKLTDLRITSLLLRAENNGQQVAGHDDRPNIFQPGQTPILAGQIMNTNNFFCLRNIQLCWQQIVITTLTFALLTANW